MIERILNLNIWNVSFRPFFLFGSFYAVLSIGLWISILLEWINIKIPVNPLLWHSYEMVYGFSKGIIFGFIFTAAQNWTGKTIAKGKSLFFLFILWFLGRLAFLPIGIFSYISFGLDIASNLLALILIAPALSTPTQKHNRIIIFHIAILTIFQILSGLGTYSNQYNNLGIHFIHIGLIQIILLISFIAGRIIPFFISVAVNNYQYKKNELLESMISNIGFLFLSLEILIFWEFNLLLFSAIFTFSYAILQFFRFLSWKPWVSIRSPILLILMIGYLWMIIGLFLYTFAKMSMFPYSSVYHIFGIGAVGIFIFGMITRVSLGHTGRKIHAQPMILLAYVFLNIAVIARVFLPLLNEYLMAYTIASFFWILSFLIFLAKYFYILINPRLDAKKE